MFRNYLVSLLARFSGRNPDTPGELALKSDTAGRTGWKVMSGADQARKGTGMGRVARAILEVLENARTSMTPLEIAAEHKGEPKLNPSSVRVNCRRMVKKAYLTEHEGGRYGIPETLVTPVTEPASDCGTATSESYSYSYSSVVRPRAATVTAFATLEILPSPSEGRPVWSMPGPAMVLPPQQASVEAATKAKPAATAQQTAQELAPAAGARTAPTTEKKDRRVCRAINGLGGTAGVQDLADYWKVVDSSKVGEIEAYLIGMCDRCILVRENTPTGTVYSTVGLMRSEVAA